MKRYFYLEESASKSGKFLIRANFTTMPLLSTTGSFNVLAARLMGLKYADYLRVCRDVFGADIIGKNERYPLAYFARTPEVEMLLKILNKRVELIMAYKEGIAAEYEKEFEKELEGLKDGQ